MKRFVAIFGHERLPLSTFPHRPGHWPLQANSSRLTDRPLRIWSEAEALQLPDGTQVLFDGDPQADEKSAVDIAGEVLGASESPASAGAFAFLRVGADGLALAARDAAGQRSLYIREWPDGSWALSSRFDWLADPELGDVEFDARAVEAFLLYGCVPPPLSIFREIWALEPGGCAHWTRGRGWHSDRWASRLPLPTPAGAFPEALGHLLAEAVARALSVGGNGSTETGIYLSGGMDSSALAILASRVNVERVRGVGLGFVGSETDFSEHEYQRRIAARCGLRLDELALDADGLEDALPEFVDRLEQPTTDGLNVFLVARHARTLGIDRVLSGFGGDEIFAGYAAFANITRQLALARMATLLPRRIGSGMASAVLSSGVGHRAKKLALLLGRAPDLGQLYALNRMLFLPQEVSLLTGGSVDDGFDWIRRPPMPERDPVAAWSLLELTNHFPDTLLQAIDLFSGGVGVSVRLPYLDPRVMRCSLAVPGNMRVGTPPKPLLRHAMAHELPAFTWDRRKRHFEVPLARWLHPNAINVAELAPILDLDGVRNVIGRISGPYAWSRIWALWILVAFLRRVRGEQPPSLRG